MSTVIPGIPHVAAHTGPDNWLGTTQPDPTGALDTFELAESIDLSAGSADAVVHRLQNNYLAFHELTEPLPLIAEDALCWDCENNLAVRSRKNQSGGFNNVGVYKAYWSDRRPGMKVVKFVARSNGRNAARADREAAKAWLTSHVGMGPRFHGVYESCGMRGYVVDYIARAVPLGDAPRATDRILADTERRVTFLQTLASMVLWSERLQLDADDLQIILDTDAGRPFLIDPGMFTFFSNNPKRIRIADRLLHLIDQNDLALATHEPHFVDWLRNKSR